MTNESFCPACGEPLFAGVSRCPKCSRARSTRRITPYAVAMGSVIFLGVALLGAEGMGYFGRHLFQADPVPVNGPPIVQGGSRLPSGPPLSASPAQPPSGPPLHAAPAQHPGGPPLTAAQPLRSPEPSISASAVPPPPVPPVTGAPPTASPAPPVNDAHPPLTEASPAPSLPETSPAATPPPKPASPPADPNRAALLAYLKRVEEIEARRKRVVSDLLPGVMTLALLQGMVGRQEQVSQGERWRGPRTDPSSLRQAGQTMDEYRNRLQQVEAEARSLRPPAPAAAFHRSYLVAIRGYGNAILDIHSAMMHMDTSLGSRIGALYEKAEGPLRASDEELGRLLTRHGLNRTFTVGEAGGGTLPGHSP